jgi:hypothetical protein
MFGYKSMKAKCYFGILTLFILTGSCGVYTEIYTNADSTTDFSVYHSYAWLPDQIDTTDMPYNNGIIRDNIRNYFGQSMAIRGYIVNLDSPDVLLSIVVLNKKKERLIRETPEPDYCRYYRGSIYYFPYRGDYYYSQPFIYCYPASYYTKKYEYMEGSITLNVVDRKQDKLIWSGTARGDIYDAAYINKNIHPAVKAIMKKYPAKPVAKRNNTPASFKPDKDHVLH